MIDRSLGFLKQIDGSPLVSIELAWFQLIETSTVGPDHPLNVALEARYE